MEKEILGLNNLLEKGVQDKVYPGCTYALIADGKTYFGCNGNKALIPSEEKNSLDTIYDMASVSKVLSTTTSILLLMERGLVRLYDQVSLFVPEFCHAKVTLFDLLTHTSGLAADLPNTKELKSREEVLEKLFKLDLSYETGTKIVYSDLGFVLLGLVIERVTAMPLDEFAKENIFIPLEMFDTGYNPKDILRCAPTEMRNDSNVRGIVRGKVHDETAYALGGVAGHAGTFSTVKDMSHFMEMILNNGMYKDKRFLSKSTIDMLFEPKVEIKNGVSLVTEKRGIGWIVKGDYPCSGDLASNNTIMHTGFTGTHVFVDRDNEVAFCLLTNRVHPTRNNTLHISFRGRVGNYIISHFGKENK